MAEDLVQGAARQRLHLGAEPVAVLRVAEAATLCLVPGAHHRGGVVDQGAQVAFALAQRGRLLFDPFLELQMQRGQFVPHPVMLHAAPHGLLQPVGTELGLGQVVGGALVHHAHRQRFVASAGDHDDRAVLARLLAQLGQQLGTAGVAEMVVEHHTIEGAVAHQLQRLGPAGGLGHFGVERASGEQASHPLAVDVVVVDDEHLQSQVLCTHRHGLGHGSRTAAW